ncbi:hypothetical protein GPALN_009772 [Globodera pallida]|nr:hypothetical protein GPALN_009772 [Globodera pallida]
MPAQLKPCSTEAVVIELLTGQTRAVIIHRNVLDVLGPRSCNLHSCKLRNLLLVNAFRPKKEWVEEHECSNIVISLWTTSAAHLLLLKAMQKVVRSPGCTLLYTGLRSRSKFYRAVEVTVVYYYCAPRPKFPTQIFKIRIGKHIAEEETKMSLDKAESVKIKLEETPLKTFDEIFGEGWWDKGEAEDLKMPAPQTLDKMSITKSTGRTPKLDKLNPIQLIRILLSQSLITLEKLNPIQLIRILLSQSLIILDKLNPIQLIRIILSQSLITLDKLNPIQLIRILLSQSLITLDKLNPIQLIRILHSQSLVTLDKLNPIQLIRILLSQSLITLDKLNPIQLIRILLSQSLVTLDKLNPI